MNKNQYNYKAPESINSWFLSYNHFSNCGLEPRQCWKNDLRHFLEALIIEPPSPPHDSIILAASSHLWRLQCLAVTWSWFVFFPASFWQIQWGNLDLLNKFVIHLIAISDQNSDPNCGHTLRITCTLFLQFELFLILLLIVHLCTHALSQPGVTVNLFANMSSSFKKVVSTHITEWDGWSINLINKNTFSL